MCLASKDIETITCKLFQDRVEDDDQEEEILNKIKGIK